MFARTWTLLAAVYFFLLLAHWAVDRGIKTFSAVTISGDHKALAAFWGMHLYAFIAPVVAVMLIRFAKSFRSHDWMVRVPLFGAFRLRPASSSTRPTAVLSLAAFIILPLVAQIHFIQQFNSQGLVYVYPSSFGYEFDDPVFQKETCYKKSIHLCTKKEAGLYSLASARPGTPAGFWDNAYHYGNRDEGEGSTVTFFPILQPAIIYLLTCLSALLGSIALYFVFRPTPERVLRRKLAMVRPVGEGDSAQANIPA